MIKKSQVDDFVLVPRDLKILQWIFEHKVLSRNQIQKHLFGNVSKQCVNYRMNKLVRADLVERVALVLGSNPKYGYSVKTHGWKLIKPQLPYEVTRKSLRSECFSHDITLFDIRIALSKKSRVADYTTENVLQCCEFYRNDDDFRSFVDLNSDAVISVKTKVGEVRLALEYERSKKLVTRYNDKLDQYYRQNGVDGVLYVCDTGELRNLIWKADLEVSGSHQCDPKVYCALLKDVLESTDEVLFSNVDKYIFRIS